MGPKEVMQFIKEKYGIERNVVILHRYSKAGLIPTPNYKSLGGGRGSSSEYPVYAPAEFYASWNLNVNYNINIKEVANARRLAYAGMDNIKKDLGSLGSLGEELKHQDILHWSKVVSKIRELNKSKEEEIIKLVKASMATTTKVKLTLEVQTRVIQLFRDGVNNELPGRVGVDGRPSNDKLYVAGFSELWWYET